MAFLIEILKSLRFLRKNNKKGESKMINETTEIYIRLVIFFVFVIIPLRNLYWLNADLKDLHSYTESFGSLDRITDGKSKITYSQLEQIEYRYNQTIRKLKRWLVTLLVVFTFILIFL